MQKKSKREGVNPIKWLMTPPLSLKESEKQKSILLNYLHLILLVFLLSALTLVVIINPPESPRRTEYLILITILTVFIGLAFQLNRSGHYLPSAVVTVFSAIAGPWGSILLDPLILKGDFVPLTYVTVSVLLSSILLTPLTTIILAACQSVGLFLVAKFSPGNSALDWPSFLAFIFITFILNIVANFINRKDMEQIDRQHQLLKISEADFREASVRDPLTGLFNRRYLEETLKREIKRAEREAYSLGIIMIDIDHFKQVNDTHGHAAGDAFLKEFGKMLKDQIRQYDVVCRYGGEEFVLMMPGISLDFAIKRAESLLDKTKALRILYNENVLESVTISLGVAVFPEHGSTGEEVLRSADEALYLAKKAGRNRAWIFKENDPLDLVKDTSPA